MSLNCTPEDLEVRETEEIYDEYDIEVSSETPAIRNSKLKHLLEILENISLGVDGAKDFEAWCHKAIRICFAKGLRNVELKPNRNAKLQRDVVATNLGEGDAWRRIYEDYGTRQVIFEIKNKEFLSAEDYQQIVSYLSGDYGRLAFVVNRSHTVDLFKDRDVEWVREMYAAHKVLIIKLTGKFLSKQLMKLRNPQKHDAVDDSVHRLLDTYTRLYVSGEKKPQPGSRRRRGHKQK